MDQILHHLEQLLTIKATVFSIILACALTLLLWKKDTKSNQSLQDSLRELTNVLNQRSTLEHTSLEVLRKSITESQLATNSRMDLIQSDLEANSKALKELQSKLS